MCNIDSMPRNFPLGGGELKAIHVFLELEANEACNLTGSRKSLA